MAHLKASINFGLVNIPVELILAEDRQQAVSFHMLDSKDNSRIRYKRVNENTGKEIEWEDIIKGYQVSENKYVTFTEEELDNLETESNQGLEIEAFVEKQEIPTTHFETPYYLSPQKGGEKGYVLLRRALENTGKYGIVQAVLRNKEHLGAIYTEGEVLILALLRYESEVKDSSEVLPTAAKKIKVSEKEVSVAEKLLKEMEGKFEIEKYKDHYLAKVKKAIAKKTSQGKTKSVKVKKDEKPGKKSVDIMELLSQSLGKKNKKSKSKAA